MLALQDPGLNTEDSRAKNFSLLVALDSGGGAKGDVFLDDGISINIARSAVFYQEGEYSRSFDLPHLMLKARHLFCQVNVMFT